MRKKCRELAARMKYLAAQGDIELTKKQLAAANCILHFYDHVDNQNEDYPEWTAKPFGEACNVLKVHDMYLYQDVENSHSYCKWQYQTW